MQRKKTVEQHKENGTYRPSRHGAEGGNLSFTPLEKAPAAPSYLGPFGKKEWKRLTVSLVENGLVSDFDLGLLELACIEYNTYRECQEFLIERNTGLSKYPIANYLHGRNSQTTVIRTDMKHAFKNYQDVILKFGASPTERAKIHAGKKSEEGDEFDEFENSADAL